MLLGGISGVLPLCSGEGVVDHVPEGAAADGAGAATGAGSLTGPFTTADMMPRISCLGVRVAGSGVTGGGALGEGDGAAFAGLGVEPMPLSSSDLPSGVKIRPSRKRLTTVAIQRLSLRFIL